MTLDELISFSTLRGDSVVHKQFVTGAGHATPFYNVRINSKKKVFAFQYHKDEVTGEKTFTNGRLTIKDPKLGYCNTVLKNWKHLERELI
jgi:hypothetical protein